jgi:PAS domain S-box-containing protein
MNKKNGKSDEHEPQALYRSIVEQLPVGIFRKDAEGRYTLVNEEFCKLRGKSAEEILGKTPADLAVTAAHKADEASLPNGGVNDHLEIMQTGKRIEAEEAYNRPNGEEYFLHVVKSPAFNSAGKIDGTLGVMIDNKLNKRVEAALAYERDLFNTLLTYSEDRIYFKDIESRFIRCSMSMAKSFDVEGPQDLIGKSDRDFFSDEHALQAYEDEQRLIKTGTPVSGKVEKETWPDGRVTWALTNKTLVLDAEGKIIGTFGISKDITAVKEAEARLDGERKLLRAIIDNSPDAIYMKDTTGRKLLANQAELKFMGCKSEAEVIGKSDFQMYPRELAEQYFADDQKVIQSREPLLNREEKIISRDGTVRWVLSSKIPLPGPDGKIIGLVGTGRDITAMKEAEEKLDQTNRQLVDASRQAGMAEVATSVLHNVGNVLNSVNVSSSVIADKMRKSKASSLTKVVALIKEHENDLGNFFANDPKGKQLPGYLASLAAHLSQEQNDILEEVKSLAGNIMHIKDIVTTQQSYAKTIGVAESLPVVGLVEDAMQLNKGAMTRHNIKIVRDFADVPPILTEKHKVLQILVNLIRNAKYACDDRGENDKQITLRIANGDGKVKISVIDNGIGILPENLTRIFNHGFTTRKEGHGFGLHNGALVAKELGGSLTAFSEGPGRGATFTLELPVKNAKR